MVQAILIPHEMNKPIALQGFDRLSVMRLSLDGYVEPIHLAQPEMTMYANEERRVQELPINRRATFLWWLFAPEMRGLDIVVGDVVVVGSARGRGSLTTLSPEFRQLLFNTDNFRIEVQSQFDPHVWRPCEEHFHDYFVAVMFGLNLVKPVAPGNDVRVVAA